MSSSSSSSSSPHNFARIWLRQQRSLRSELLSVRPDADAALISRALAQYDTYFRARAQALRSDPVWFFSAPWATPLERALHWAAGWRPNILIHLLYTESGMRFEAQLDDILLGVHSGDLGDLTATQLRRVDELQRRTVREEDEIARDMAALQEGVAEQFLPGDSDLEAKAEQLGLIIARADALRLRTVREVVGILKPIQAVDLLVATADFELAIRELGVEQERGRR